VQINLAKGEKESLTGKPGLNQKSQLKETLFSSPEGRCLLTGVALALVFTVWLSVKLLLSPADIHVFMGIIATQIIFSRAGSIAFGYSMGFEPGTVIPICIIIETVQVLILFPLFFFSLQHLLVIKRLKTMFDRIQKSAETHRDVVRSYGVAGLFFFVWFPFWMTGPVVGCVIGFMMGLRLRLNMAVVLTGTYAAIFGWAIFLRYFHDRTGVYGSYATIAILIFLLVVIIAGYLLHKTLHDRRKKDRS